MRLVASLKRVLAVRVITRHIHGRGVRHLVDLGMRFINHVISKLTHDLHALIYMIYNLISDLILLRFKKNLCSW